MGPVLDQSRRAMTAYADRFGYDLVVGDGDSCGRPGAWAKVPLLRQLLDTYAVVVWVDADAIIMDMTADIASLLPADSFQALVEVRVVGDARYRRHPNTGVWVLRDTERARSFLQQVWDATTYVDHPLWENAAVIDLLGFDLDPGRGPARPSPWMSGTHWLPEEWNMLVGAHGLVRCRIRHYAALSNSKRVRWMRPDAVRVAATLDRWTPVSCASYVRLATVRWFDRSCYRLRRKFRYVRETHTWRPHASEADERAS
jgi:hypothetical protein